ncbi:MAG TPA: CBS domain-containing protein [Burkholderiales bacterium]
MREQIELSAAFVEAHPAEAARVLEGLAPDDAAAFVAALDAGLAAVALHHLGVAYCARVLQQLNDDQAAERIRVMGSQSAARLLLNLAPERQVRLLGRLPVGTAMALRLLIGYPKGTCGACMDPAPLVLSPDTTVAEAIEQARRHEERERGDCAFVADAQRRLIGVVTLGDLLRAPPGEPLSTVMRNPEHTVSALASATTAAAHPGWDWFHLLPVVERENRIVGGLHRRSLARELGDIAVRSGPALVTGVTGAYWQTVSSLAQVVVRTLPPASTVATKRRSDER